MCQQYVAAATVAAVVCGERIMVQSLGGVGLQGATGMRSWQLIWRSLWGTQEQRGLKRLRPYVLAESIYEYIGGASRNFSSNLNIKCYMSMLRQAR